MRRAFITKKESVKTNAKKENKKDVVLLDTNSIAEAVAKATDGQYSPTLRALLKRVEVAGLGSPDKRLSDLIPVSEEHEKMYVHYGDEKGKPVTLEADIILVLRYKLGEENVGNLLHEAHKKDLEGYAHGLYKQYCGNKEFNECLAIVWDAYLTFLHKFCIVVHDTVYMSNDSYVFRYALALADRKDRALMSMPYSIPVDVLQTKESILKMIAKQNLEIKDITEQYLVENMTARQKNNISPRSLLFLLWQDCVVVKKHHAGNFCDEDGISGFVDETSELNQVSIGSPEEEAVRKTLFPLVKKVLMVLPEKDKLAVYIFADYAENELTIKELAKRYNVSEGQACNLKKKGLELLKKELKDYHE